MSPARAVMVVVVVIPAPCRPAVRAVVPYRPTYGPQAAQVLPEAIAQAQEAPEAVVLRLPALRGLTVALLRSVPQEAVVVAERAAQQDLPVAWVGWWMAKQARLMREAR
jgi:hypothetical protein